MVVYKSRYFEKLEENVKSSYLWSLGDSITDLFINRSIALHSIVMLAAAFFGGGSLVATMIGAGVGASQSLCLVFVCL